MKKIAILVAGVFLVSGCATPGQGQNAVGGAVAGGLAGCLLFSAMGGNCSDGAKIGAIVGGIIGYNYEAKKIASTDAVNAQARQAGIVVPKDKVVLQSYNVNTNTSTIQQAAGGVVVSDSTINLIGNSKTPPKVEEKIYLIHPDGTMGSPQTGKLSLADGAGSYTSKGRFSIPKGYPQGKYTVKSELWLNDKIADTKSFKVQVAYADGNQLIQLASVE